MKGEILRSVCARACVEVLLFLIQKNCAKIHYSLKENLRFLKST